MRLSPDWLYRLRYRLKSGAIVSDIPWVGRTLQTVDPGFANLLFVDTGIAVAYDKGHVMKGQPFAFTRVAAAMSLVVLCVGRIQADTQPPTVDQVLAGLKTIEKKVFETHSFFVDYERDAAIDHLDSYMAGKLPARWTQAFYRDRWYSERRFTRPFTGIYEKGIVKTKVAVPAKPSIHVLKDGVTIEWDQSRNTASILRFSESGNLYSGLHYTTNLSLDAPKYIAAAGNVKLVEMRKINTDYTSLPFLPEFLESNRSNYRVSTAQETTNGILCWIVEWPDMDRIAVDVNKGFAVIRRTYHWGPGKPIRVEVTNSDHREVKPGLWLPFQQEETRFASIVSDPKEVWGKRASTSRYRVHAIRFDDLDDRFFQINLSPKTRVMDSVRKMNYETAASNADPFPEAIAQVLTDIQAAKRRQMWGAIILGLQAFTFFFVVAAFISRYRNHRGRNGVQAT